VRIRFSFLPDQVSKVVALFNRSRLGECRNDENPFEARIADRMAGSLNSGRQ